MRCQDCATPPRKKRPSALIVPKKRSPRHAVGGRKADFPGSTVLARLEAWNRPLPAESATPQDGLENSNPAGLELLPRRTYLRHSQRRSAHRSAPKHTEPSEHFRLWHCGQRATTRELIHEKDHSARNRKPDPRRAGSRQKSNPSRDTGPSNRAGRVTN